MTYSPLTEIFRYTFFNSLLFLIQVVDPQYGMFTWPCAPVLAQYLFYHQDQINGKKVLEVNCPKSFISEIDKLILNFVSAKNISEFHFLGNVFLKLIFYIFYLKIDCNEKSNDSAN